MIFPSLIKHAHQFRIVNISCFFGKPRISILRLILVGGVSEAIRAGSIFLGHSENSKVKIQKEKGKP